MSAPWARPECRVHWTDCSRNRLAPIVESEPRSGKRRLVLASNSFGTQIQESVLTILMCYPHAAQASEVSLACAACLYLEPCFQQLGITNVGRLAKLFGKFSFDLLFRMFGNSRGTSIPFRQVFGSRWPFRLMRNNRCDHCRLGLL